MTQQIKVVPYSSAWPVQYKLEASRIKECLGSNIIELHHIGSTAVPGLAAKPDIDILCVVADLNATLKLKGIGFEFRGELNIPLRYFFKGRWAQGDVNLHVTLLHTGFSPLNILFRDCLRHDDRVRDAYEALKRQLAADPEMHKRTASGLVAYTLAKNDFIKDVLDGAGYDALCLNFCMHYEEWRMFNQLMGTQLSDETKLEGHHYFVLYRGTTVIAAAERSENDVIKVISVPGAAPREIAYCKAQISLWTRISSQRV